jgi:hypothetical protein
MRFAVRLLMHRGRALGRLDIVNQAPIVGELRIEQLEDGARRRSLKLARLIAQDSWRGLERLTLYEPVIVGMSQQAFTLSGFERAGDTDYAQSWLVSRPVDSP